MDAFSWFMDVTKSTCSLKKKGDVEGTAFSYLLQTIGDVVLEDVIRYFLSLKNRKLEILYTLQSRIFDGLQLIPSELEDFKKDIISASDMTHKKYSWGHFNLELKHIDSLYMPQNGKLWKSKCLHSNQLSETVQLQICNRSLRNFTNRD